MIRTELTRTGGRRTRPPAASPAAAPPTMGVTIYGCEPDEAALFHEVASRLGVEPTMTEEPLSDDNTGLAIGNRCISIGHKTQVANSTLRALRGAGVTYVSTRSIGHNHLDVGYAKSLGLTVESVTYSPDGVADYTLMLILMAVRNAASISTRAAAQDYRLPEARARELRDLTVGVIGAGRIGGAVLTRLRGFGCRTMVYDSRPAKAAGVCLDMLLETSDVVTLHTPLTAETHHLLHRDRINRMKPGAVLVNTGRGALVDTAALVDALHSGRLGGAALDVVEGEEEIFYADRRGSTIDNPLLLRLHDLPNVVVTPHVAYYTERALRDTVENSLANCLAFAREESAWVG